jgi:hypothetical protein
MNTPPSTALRSLCSFLAYRVLIFLLPLCFYGMFAFLLFAGHEEIYKSLQYYWGVTPVVVPPFADIHSVLASAECHRLGLDVAQYNPCDLWRRPFDYPPIWFLLVPDTLGPADTMWAGILIDLLFIASLPLVLRPQSISELACFSAASISPTVVFAAERANPDLILFLLILVAALAFGRNGLFRAFSYAAFLCGAALKFYPISLMVLAAREHLRAVLIIAVTTVTVVVAYILTYAHELRVVWAAIPQPHPFTMIAFSAKFLPMGMLELFPALGRAWPSFVIVATAALGLVSCLVAAAIARHILTRIDGIGLSSRDQVYLVVGSVLIAACFFASANIGYRGIFFLFVLSGMVSLARQSRGLRMILYPTIACIVVILWGEFLARVAQSVFNGANVPPDDWSFPRWGLWFAGQLTWWWTVSVLLGVVLAFLRRSPLLADLRSVSRRLHF